MTSAFGGLIATGVSFLSGKANLYGWQWLLVLILYVPSRRMLKV